MSSTADPAKAKPDATRRKPATAPETLTLDRFGTPIGTALLVTDAAGRLCALDWSDYEERLTTLLRRQHGMVTLQPGAAPPALRRALADYFEGHRRAAARSPSASKCTSARLIAACRVGAVICAPKRSVT